MWGSPVADSKRKTILNYLRDTTFARLDGLGAYTTEVKTVERGLRPLDQLADGDLPALFIGKTTEKRSNITHNQFRSVITVFVVGFIEGRDGDSAQEAMDDFIADTTRALETDRLLGGNAKHLEIKNIVTDDGNMAPRAGFVVEVDIAYATEGVTP